MNRLGFWAFVPPETRVFVPEVEFSTVPTDCQLWPLLGHAHTVAVMGPPDDSHCRACIGFALVGLAEGATRSVGPLVLPPRPPARGGRLAAVAARFKRAALAAWLVWRAG